MLHHFFVQVYNVLTLIAIGFALWGMVKATRADKPENVKNRTYNVKTFWVLFFGSIVWSVAWLIPLFDGVFVWTHFLAFIVMLERCYHFKTIYQKLS